MLLAGTLSTEKTGNLEVGNLVAPSENNILGTCLVELSAGHAQGEDAGGAVFHLERHVVVEREVQTHQGREALVDGDGADVVH